MNPWMSLWAAVAVLGFAMVFSVPRRTLPGIALLAVAAHLLRAVCLEQGITLPAASLLAALFVGATAAVVAPRTGEATPIYAFAPVIPLVPGTAMFDTLIGLLALTSGTDPAARVDQVAVDATTATLTIIALAVGAIGPTLVLGRHIARLMDRAPVESDG